MDSRFLNYFPSPKSDSQDNEKVCKRKLDSSEIDEIDAKRIAFFSTSHENMEIDEEAISYPPWSELPSPAIEKIYLFLNRSDQRSMSSVCRNWRNEFGSPSLWRKVTFKFPDLDTYREWCPDAYYAWRYGGMIRHLEIVFIGGMPQLSISHKTYFNQLKCFLQAVTAQSQLSTISLKLCITFPSVLHRLYPQILKLMESQRKLRFVDISVCRYQNFEAAKIMKALFENNSNTLRRLHLQNFVIQTSRAYFTDITVDDDLNFCVFMNLEMLSIDYTAMFENMVLSFYEYRNKVDMTRRTGCLKQINLLYDGGGLGIADYAGIHPDVWKYFCRIFPGLSVDVCVYCNHDSLGLSAFIAPLMPLTALHYHFSFHGPDVVVTLLSRITSCGINKRLELLEISTERSCASKTLTELTRFLSICTQLKTLELEFCHPVTGLDTMFNSWLENRPLRLEVVKITVKFTPEEQMIYISLNDFYAPLLQPLGIHLSLISYS